jgi:hypothetical protein
MIKVYSNTIEIAAIYFAGQESGFSDFDKDILSDVFEKIYTNQQIIINAIKAAISDYRTRYLMDAVH